MKAAMSDFAATFLEPIAGAESDTVMASQRFRKVAFVRPAPPSRVFLGFTARPEKFEVNLNHLLAPDFLSVSSSARLMPQPANAPFVAAQAGCRVRVCAN